MDRVKYVLCCLIMAGVAYFAWQYFESRGKETAEIVRNTPKTTGSVTVSRSGHRFYVGEGDRRSVISRQPNLCLKFTPSSVLEIGIGGTDAHPINWQVRAKPGQGVRLIEVTLAGKGTGRCPWRYTYSSEDPRSKAADPRSVVTKRWQNTAQPHSWKVIESAPGQCIHWGSQKPVYAQVMKTESNSWMHWDRYSKLILRDKPLREEIAAIRFKALPQDKWGVQLFLERRIGRCVQKTKFKDSYQMGRP